MINKFSKDKSVFKDWRIDNRSLLRMALKDDFLNWRVNLFVKIEHDVSFVLLIDKS